MFYPKKNEKNANVKVHRETATSVTGFFSCILMLFLVCYSFALCVDSPVSFTTGQFAVYVFTEILLLILLVMKFRNDWKYYDFNIFGIMLFMFSLIVFIIWIMLVINDFEVMSDVEEEAFRGKVYFMDIVGILTCGVSTVYQFILAIRYYRNK